MMRFGRVSAAFFAMGILCGCGAAVDLPLPSEPTASAAPSTSSGPVSSFRTDPIFSQQVLHNVELTLDPEAWQALRENFRENQYYAADFVLDGQKVEQVGIRSRGSGSRDPRKPGLKVDFNKYVKAQEFHGYKSLVVDNITQDPSFIRERLAYDVYEAMGIPSPQISHARLTVNGEYWGCYALIEPVSKPFLKNRLGDDTGNLYDYQYAYRWDFSFLGDDPEAYVPSPFQPQTHEDDLDPSGLIDFIRTANDAPYDGFSEAIAKFLDVDRFLTYVAVENALAERDGFVGEYGVNNFYLYQYGNTTRFVFIPWDKDTAFNNSEWPIRFNLEANVLTDKITADPAKMKVYQDAVARAAQVAVNTRFLGPRLEQAYQQIEESVLSDEKKPWTNAAFEGEIEILRDIIDKREADVMAQLAAAGDPAVRVRTGSKR
jgi:spore coat protein CotH